MLTISHTVGLSPIHGLGVFTTETIPKGAMVCRFVSGIDCYLSDEEISALPQYARDFLDMYSYRHIHSGRMMVCGDNDRFMNHSKKPNIINDPLGFDDECRMVAARDILPGEELTCNYESFDMDFPTYGHLFESEILFTTSHRTPTFR